MKVFVSSIWLGHPVSQRTKKEAIFDKPSHTKLGKRISTLNFFMLTAASLVTILFPVFCPFLLSFPVENNISILNNPLEFTLPFLTVHIHKRNS